MCGRFTLSTPWSRLAELFGLGGAEQSLAPRWNIAPGQEVAAVVREGDRRVLVPLLWGLIPSWARERKGRYTTINARAETAAALPAFRRAFRHGRCLIPADGFYEWKTEEGGRRPFHLHLPDRAPFALAALRERNPALDTDSMALLTTGAKGAVARIHDRMPVILPPGSWEAWLDPDLADPGAVSRLLEVADPGLEATPVSTRVNRIGIDDEGLIAEMPGRPGSTP